MIKLKSLLQEGSWYYRDTDEGLGSSTDLQDVLSFEYSRSLLDRIKTLFKSEYFANISRIKRIVAEYSRHYEKEKDYIEIVVSFANDTIPWTDSEGKKQMDAIVFTSKFPFTGEIKIDGRWDASFAPEDMKELQIVGKRLFKELLDSHCCSRGVEGQCINSC